MGNLQAKIRVQKARIPELGDKFSSRAGQGTIGMLIKDVDMPRTEDGMTPDIIVNPHALPSRMTIGQLIEMLSTQYGLMLGSIIDGTIFDNQDPISDLSKKLPKLGIHPHGDYQLYSGNTGNMMSTSVFFGPCYYMRLKHQVVIKLIIVPLVLV